MNHICQTGEKTQFIPPEKHPSYPWYILARQSVQHRGPVPSQPSKHVHPAQTAQTALAGACLPHGGWPHPKRHTLWKVGIWKEIQRPPQLYYKDVCKRNMKALGMNTDTWEDLTADRLMWRSTLNQHLKIGEKTLVNAEAGRRARRKECNTQMRLLWQRLFLPHRSLQPQATLQQSKRHNNQDVFVVAIVS